MFIGTGFARESGTEASETEQRRKTQCADLPCLVDKDTEQAMDLGISRPYLLRSASLVAGPQSTL